MYNSIELFAGAGGLALGLEKAGFNHIGLVEFDKYAANTLKVNRPEWNVLCEDIEEVASRNLEKEFNIKSGELDLLSGGAPCQSFSYAGKRLGLNDIRGTMFYHYATFLHKLQPKMFLFENVKGLLTHDKGKTYETILNIFKDEGYTTLYQVLNAWDYGVAQKRDRLITIGIRNDLMNKCKYKFPKKHSYKPVLRDILLDVPESEGAKYSDYKKSIFKLVPPGGYWRDIDPNIAKEYMKTCWNMGGGRTGILRRLSLDEPSLTVLTTPQMKQTDRCHPIEVRPFNIRESARIQSFPDEWSFQGSIASQYKQIGNAVPCNLAKEIGIEIINTLNQIYGIEMKNKIKKGNNIFSSFENKQVVESINYYKGEKYMYNLKFISKKDFKNHVKGTIKQYNEQLKGIDLKSFNSNIIDPIKLLFDNKVYKKKWEQTISDELQRQRDKSNNNAIGYFHQNMFKFIKKCEVPKEGFDVIYHKSERETIYVEMKNKHNTMNSGAAQKVYIQMQNKLLQDPYSECYLVESIAKHSQNKVWKISINGNKVENDRIKRVSLDKFYEIVTGEKDAFYKMCCVLPDIIDEVISENASCSVEEDTVFDELKKKNPDMLKSLYMLAFSEYEGFEKLEYV